MGASVRLRGSTSVGRSAPRPLSRLCYAAPGSPADSHQRVGRKHVPRRSGWEVTMPHSWRGPLSALRVPPGAGGTGYWATASQPLIGRRGVPSRAAGVAPAHSDEERARLWPRPARVLLATFSTARPPARSAVRGPLVSTLHFHPIGVKQGAGEAEVADDGSERALAAADAAPDRMWRSWIQPMMDLADVLVRIPRRVRSNGSVDLVPG